MDADGLPLIGPGIDFSKVEAIHQKRTLAFLNHFIIHTSSFLNKFSCVCEEKLEALAVKVQRLETSMTILEAKLSSVPGLENITVQQAKSNNEPEQNKDTPQQQTAQVTVVIKPDTSVEVVTQDAKDEPQPQIEDAPPQNKVSQDPMYARFFKMLTVGIPLPAVKQKMLMEGLNPDYLDTPDAAAPSHVDVDSDEEVDQNSSSDDSSAGFSD